MAQHWLTSTPIAHRGLHLDNEQVPENSMAAFKKAIDAGYAIECDIHLLADGAIAVFHDDDLLRMCGARVDIATLTAAQLQQFTLSDTGEQIPLLADVLMLVKGAVPLLIEIKAQKRNLAIQKTLADLLEHYNGAVAIQSFNPPAMRLLPKLLPAVPRGQLSCSYKHEVGDKALHRMLRRYAYNSICKPSFIAHEAEDIICNPVVNQLRQKGLPVLCWTVRSAEQRDTVSNYCDNIIFEGFDA